MDKPTLVIGASANPERYSYMAIERLLKHNISVQALGNKKGFVKDVEIITQHEDIKKPIHTISIYINPKIQNNYIDFILSLKPERIIFNPGTENPDIYPIFKKANIDCLEACNLVMLSTKQF